MFGRPAGSPNKAKFLRGDPLRRLRSHISESETIADGVASPCWLWVGRVDGGGYAQVRLADRSPMAHRWSYELLIGPIPDGLTLDHLCRRPSCVNPEHLEPVTQRVNNLRAPKSISTINLQKTYCPAGHPYDEANTYHMPNGGRDCKQCILQRSRDRNDRRRGGPPAGPKTHCPQGHPYDDANTYFSRSSGRMCRECGRTRSRERARRKRAERSGTPS